MKKISCLFINPLTAFSFIQIMKKNNYTTAIHTAGYSAVGKIFQKLANKESFKIVNILRK
jgi:hypothetical protein